MDDEEQWYCQTCGDFGLLPADVTVDQFQCPSCGEPVTPG